jgi:hypothetical protein
MPIQVSCPCGKSVRVKDEWAGKKARCSGCSRIVTIPNPKKATVKEEEILDVVAVEEEDDEVVTCDPIEEKSSRGRITTKPRPRIHDDDDEDEAPRRPKLRRNRDDDDDEDERPRARRLREDDDEDDDERPRARRDREERKPRPKRPRPRRESSGSSSSAATAGIFGGLAMMVGAVVWFILGLYNGWLFYYPPILFVMGVIAFVRGLMGKD